MSVLADEVEVAVRRIRRAGTDLQDVEVKSAAGGLPKSVVESVCAFANAAGGLLLLGLDENEAFAVVQIDASKLASDLASACSDQLEPPIRAEIDIVELDGHSLVAAYIGELPTDRKPCYVRSRGLERGSYLRTHDGDRVLSTYEVHVLLSSRSQALDDTVPVPGATVADLDEGRVEALVRRLRSTRGPVFATATDAEILRLLGVTVDSGAGQGVTLAGLLALGRYPQQFYPQLDVTFVAYPTTTGEPLADGTRFVDNQSIDGSIPVMVEGTMAALRRNMRRRSIVAGVGREDRWEYPEEAVREVIANALMHRDYHPLTHGAQVRVALYPDRVEIVSPGGLFGPIAREDLLAEPVSSSRNARLAKLLEDVESAGGRTVCENRGSGLLAAASALRAAGLQPPELIDAVREFRVVIRNHGLLDDESLTWLRSLDTAGLSDRQRLGLAFLHRHGRLTNQQYRTLTGCDSLSATRDLTALASRGLVEKSNDRRWAVWHLRSDTRYPTQPELHFDVPDPKKRDRRAEIRRVLAEGPLSASAIGDRLGISRQGALNWLRRLEDEGVVVSTGASRRSPKNAWNLVSRQNASDE